MRRNESVAKDGKVCPMTLRVDEGDRLRSHKCLGSECMAWRGKDVPETFTFKITGIADIAMKAEKPLDETVIPAKEAENTGYCGIAGPPE
jgi:hypothetical protein